MRGKGVMVIIYGIICGLLSFVLLTAASGCGQTPYGVDKFNLFASVVWNISGILGVLSALSGPILCFIGGIMLILSKMEGRIFSFLGVLSVMFASFMSLVMSVTLSISNNYWEAYPYLVLMFCLSITVGSGTIIIKILKRKRTN